MPLVQCPHCIRQFDVPQVATEAVVACPCRRRTVRLYKCFSCMKVTAFNPALPMPRACPRCNTLIRSGAPLVLRPFPMPERKRIVIEIFEAPGTGNVANARNIFLALRRRYTVHILVSGSGDAVLKVFGGDITPADPRAHYDILIVPGIELRIGMGIRSRMIRPTPVFMHLPPPFCSHLFQKPFVRRMGGETVLALDDSLPFLPQTRNLRMERAPDYKGLKAAHFPHVDPANVFFIVTYIGLDAPVPVDLFKDYEECVIILNFGTRELKGNGKTVVSLKCPRLSMVEFEECLLQCVTIYPAVTDGGNTVATLQALELPYYDLAMKRVLFGKQAFLNEGTCNMSLFRTLASRAKNGRAFELLLEKTRAYYAGQRDARRGGRGRAICSIVEEVLR